MIRLSLPSADEVRSVQGFHRAGWKPGAIARKVFGADAHAKVVREIIATPEMYDPYVDQVAVSRALQGDRNVWASMTHYERREALLRYQEAPEWVPTEVWGFESLDFLCGWLGKSRSRGYFAEVG